MIVKRIINHIQTEASLFVHHWWPYSLQLQLKEADREIRELHEQVQRVDGLALNLERELQARNHEPAAVLQHKLDALIEALDKIDEIARFSVPTESLNRIVLWVDSALKLVGSRQHEPLTPEELEYGKEVALRINRKANEKVANQVSPAPEMEQVSGMTSLHVLREDFSTDRLTLPRVQYEISVRQSMLPKLVGNLYPSILADEIAALRDMERHLKRHLS